MKYALLFKENEESILVSADDVKKGKYSRYDEFVDPEYEFKVRYVSGARNHGGAYFRLYYSYEEYKKLYPDRATRYEIVADMRRYNECAWHKEWKSRVSDFCSIEKCIKNPYTKKYKFADAFHDETQTCVEFQHSYIAWDFEERNKFYDELSIKTIWLYDLPYTNLRQDDQGNMEILEDNARGFFRISEKPDNLKRHFVYIQVKSKMIYRVTELFRKDITKDKKSTIRYFVPTEVYSEEEFVLNIKNGSIYAERKKSNQNSVITKRLDELWSSDYLWMIVRNVENGDVILVNCDHNFDIFRDYSNGCIKYTYVDNKYGCFGPRKEYWLSHYDEKRAIWELVSKKINPKFPF